MTPHRARTRASAFQLTATRALVAAALCIATLAHAQPATNTQAVRFDGLGGAALEVPNWKEVRREGTVAVFEQLPDPATQKPYYVLMCALEEGPPKGQPIAWEKVRDNIVQAASKNGRTLALEVKEPYSGAAGFESRRFTGEFTSATPDKKVGIELLVLVKDGKLVTIGLIAEALGPPTTELLQGVAKTARLGP